MKKKLFRQITTLPSYLLSDLANYLLELLKDKFLLVLFDGLTSLSVTMVKSRDS